MLKAEVVETLIYGCMTWSPNKPDVGRLRRVRPSILFRCPGGRERKRHDHTPSYGDALAKTASGSIEAKVHKGRLLFAGFVARKGDERLPQRVMFGELVRGKGYSGGQDKDWMGHLNENMSVFGIKSEGWRKAVQKAGRRF